MGSSQNYFNLSVWKRMLRMSLLAVMLTPLSALAVVDWVVNNDDAVVSVPAGSDITYTVRVDNSGDTPAPSTTLTLTIDPATTFVSATGLTCSGTGPVTCTVPALLGAFDVGYAPVSVAVVVRTSTLTSPVTLGASVPTAGDNDAGNNVANEPTLVTAGADLEIGITGTATAQAGGAVSYTLTAVNNGPSPASNFVVSFPIPTGVVNVTPSGGCSLAGSTYNCTIAGPVAVGGSVARTFTGQVSAASGSTITASGSVVAGTPPDPISANNTDTFNTPVTPGSDVTIGKSHSPAGTLLVGDAVTFTLSPSYTGDSPNTLTITDIFPANYTIGVIATPQNGWACGKSVQTVTCTKAAGTVAGANVSLGTISIPATVASVGAGVVNTANIDVPVGLDPNLANNSGSDSATNILAATVDLQANKSGPVPTLVVQGNAYSYDISASNVGTAAFYGTLVMTDAVPAGLQVDSFSLNGWACSPAPVFGGPQTVTCTRTYTVGAPLAAGATAPAVTFNTTVTGTGAINNVMTVSSPDANIVDTNPANDTVSYGVTSSTPGNSADLSVNKTVDLPTAAVGDVLTYTIEIVNAGTSTSDNVTLTDDLLDLISGNVGPTGEGYIGQSIVLAGTSTGGSCSNSAYFLGGNNRFMSCTFASIGVCTPGSNCPKVQVQVRPGGNGGNRTNGATVSSSSTADPNHINDSGSVTSTILPRADVTVSKSASLASVPAGQNLTYVVTATNVNNGMSSADNVTITDTLPNNLVFVSATPSVGSCATKPAANSTTGAGNNQVICNLGTIANGSQQTVTMVVRPKTITAGTNITNNVSVATSTTEINVQPNSGSVVTEVTAPALNLFVDKVDDVDPVAVTDFVVYTVQVINQGPSAAENVVVTDTLPTSTLTYDSHTAPADGSCGLVGNVLTCTVPYLAAGAVTSFTVTMQGSAKGVDSNVATVTSDEVGSGGTADNSGGTETTTVRTKVDLAVDSKTPSAATVNLREDFNFVITVRNRKDVSLAEADDTVVSDTLPAGMQLTGAPTVSIPGGSTAVITQNTCTGVAGGTSFTCNLGTFSGNTGSTDTALVQITVPVQLVSVTSMPQTFTNTATISTSSKDVNTLNDSNTGSVSVNSSSLAGRVFRDFNNGGTFTAGDTGISGITVTLTGTTFDGVPITRTVTTDASGNYNFTGLPQSNGAGYTVTEGTVSEAFLSDGTDTAGVLGGNTAVNDVISAIVIPANTVTTGYNFAEIPQARVGIAKAVTAGPIVNADGTFNTTFQLVVENFSLEDLNGVVVTDVMNGVAPNFGTFVAGGAAATLTNGDYTVQAAPTGTCTGLNAGFNGSAVTTAATMPTLAAGASCTINFTLRTRSTVPQPPVSGVCGARYCNQAAVNGGTGAISGQTSATNAQLLDTSDNGANPDPDNDNQANEAGENDPTPVTPTFNNAIGIAKQLNGNVSVDTDGSLIVPIRLVVTNVGNEPLNTVTVTDPLSTAASGLFGTFVPGGAGAVLATGQYTVQIAPAFSGACASGAVSAGFTGHTGNLQVASIANMAIAASCTLDFTYRFKPVVATTYTNQAAANGKADYTGLPVTDLSDNGNNPDTDGDGTANEAGENDPTPVPVPRIGLAKSVGGVVNNLDGTYTVPFTLTINNAGSLPLSSVQINDDLTGTNASGKFGTYTSNAVPAAGQYTIVGAPTILVPTNGASLTPVAAGVFTGSGAGTGLLIPASSSLPNVVPSASSAQVRFTVRFFPTTPGPFNNSAVANGSPLGGGTVTDDSVNGAIPDANSNGDPNDDASPTPVSLAGQQIGVAKAVGNVVQTGTKKFRIPYSIIVANTSTVVTATNVQVTDSLNTTFPTAQSIAISTPAAVSGCTGTVLTIAAPAFTGVGQNNLLIGNQNLQAGERCTITFTTEVDFGTNPLPTTVQNNQARATTAQTSGGTEIADDLSDNGINPDTDGDTNANEAGENDPTPVSFASGALSSVSGKVWMDTNHDRTDNDSSPVGGFTVEVLNAAGVVVGRTTSAVDGTYLVTGLFPSTAGDSNTYYSVRFRDPINNAIYATPVSQDPTPDRNGVVNNGVIASLQLAPGTQTLNQNLPLDPTGVVYNSITRNPVAGAQVTLYTDVGGIQTPVPATCLIGGVNTQTTGATGMYQYQLINPAPVVPVACPGNTIYTIGVVQPGGYLPPVAVQGGVSAPAGTLPVTGPAGGVNPIQTQAGPPTGAQPTTYYFSFDLDLVNSANIVNNHIPLDPVTANSFFVTKTGNKSVVEIGDTIMYTVKVKLTNGLALAMFDLVDNLPAGFRYIPGTAYKSTGGSAPVQFADPAGSPGPQLTFKPTFAAVVTDATITYKVRVGVGAMQGDGINRVQGRGVGGLVSNIAAFKVKVTGGVFTNDACVAGKVFVDCNSNHIQDPEELGVPGVRLYMEDGTYFITDVEGKYSYCGISPRTHVLKADNVTLPRGSRLTTTSNRNAGDANSLFLDVKNGELIRGDFAEGSCSNTVLEQVKARRSQGEVRAPETERKGGPALKFEGKSPNYPQQGTDSANQPIVKPRGGGGAAHITETVNNQPVNTLPEASGNTRGNNLRDMKGGANAK